MALSCVKEASSGVQVCKRKIRVIYPQIRPLYCAYGLILRSGMEILEVFRGKVPLSWIKVSKPELLRLI